MIRAVEMLWHQPGRRHRTCAST